jgi:D-glycero-D-manno-heptose 1,7-bisphosphate phosphatase
VRHNAPKIVLLDRDGTVIVDPPDERVDTVDKIQLFPDTIAALKELATAAYAVIFVTNQAGIAEGRLTEQDFERINNKVIELLAPSGIKVLKTYMSPHGTNDTNDWRKPGPGMLLQAAADFSFNLADTYMVGDRLSDVQAGQRAGAKTILVKTANTPIEAPEATHTATTLHDAVRYLLAH